MVRVYCLVIAGLINSSIPIAFRVYQQCRYMYLRVSRCVSAAIHSFFSGLEMA